MGDPRFSRRMYETPKHPWEATRMDEERKMLERYGLKNKRELWKAQSVLRGFRRQARDLQARLRANEPQAQRETDQLLGRLKRLGLLTTPEPTLDDVLALSTEDLLRRRFDAIVARRGLSPTVRAARKWIVHGHFSLGGHRVTRPGLLVPSAQEGEIEYSPTSPYADADHPARVELKQRTDVGAATSPGTDAPSAG